MEAVYERHADRDKNNPQYDRKQNPDQQGPAVMILMNFEKIKYKDKNEYIIDG